MKKVLIIILLLFSLTFSQSWLSGWQYRIPITIKENSGKNLTDYQVLITLDTASLISAGKMKSDCGDIRFTDSDGTTLLNYWIESGCNSANTRIWIKIPNIPASGTKTIYLYYGNPSANSLSNGDLVFDFFDDFESYADGSDINNQGGWITKRVGGTGEAKVRLVNGRKHLHLSSTDSATAVVHPVSTNNSGYAIRLYEFADDWDEALLIGFSDGNTLADGHPYNGYDVTWWGWGGGTSRIRKWVNGAQTYLASISDSDSNNVYHLLEFVWIGSNLYAYRDGILKLSASDTTFNSFSHIYLGEWAGSSRYIDWVLVRKYTSPEPTYTLGSEEIFQTQRINITISNC
ncbi:MAG: DUF2341 domain-containing protein [Candidatus Aenigmatarchaeota archaeon]